MTVLEIEIETGEPEAYPNARWGYVRIGPRIIFSEMVYDTEKDGTTRSAAQAETNLMTLFVERLRRALEDA